MDAASAAPRAHAREAINFREAPESEDSMPKAYVIARVDVTNPDAYAIYAAAATEALKKSGGRALARGGRHEALEGQARARNIIIEFDSFDAARSYYFSELYQTAKAKREGAAFAEFVLVEGV